MNDPRIRPLVLAALERLFNEFLAANVMITKPETIAFADSSLSLYLCVGPARRGQDRTPVRPASDLALTEMESAVLTVLGHLGPDQVLTGSEIATKAGYPYHAGLKACLATLRRRGLVENRAPGYALVRTP